MNRTIILSKRLPLMKLIESLAQKKNTEVYLVTGRKKTDLENWWSGIPIGIICEHRLWIKKRNEENWQMTDNARKDWKKIIIKVIETFTARTPGSFIEEKEFSLVWHFRKANPYLGETIANDLEAVLTNLISIKN